MAPVPAAAGLDRDHPAGRWMFLPAVLAASVLLVSMSASIRYTSRPDFCAGCHEMRPEYVTWKASAHVKVGCTKCHVGAGTWELVKHKISAGRQVTSHVLGRYFLPIELRRPMGDEVCTGCHSENRLVTASGDLIVPHDAHRRSGLGCVRCHSGVVHGRVAEREETVDGRWEKWTEGYGKSQVLLQYRLPGMNDCIECHSAGGAPTDCAGCHRKIVPPGSHGTPSWEAEHGPAALSDVKECDRCHSNTMPPKLVRVKDPVVQYARTNTLCSGCHAGRPSSHAGEWKDYHADRARDDQKGCMVCHEAGKPKPAQNAAKSFCRECHTGVHGRLPPGSHPFPLEGRKPGPQCTGCHPARVCGRCHSMAG